MATISPKPSRTNLAGATNRRGKGWINSRLMFLMILMTIVATIIFVRLTQYSEKSSLLSRNSYSSSDSNIHSHNHGSSNSNSNSNSYNEIKSNKAKNDNEYRILSIFGLRKPVAVANSYVDPEEFTKRWLLQSVDGQYSTDKIIQDTDSSLTITNFYSNRTNYEIETDKDVSPFDLMINVWDRFPPNINCPNAKRVGAVGEGGKWICDLYYLNNRSSNSNSNGHSRTVISGSTNSPRSNSYSVNSGSDCVIYSYGISTDITFEIDMLLSTKCMLHAFDPTVGKLPLEHIEKFLNKSMIATLLPRVQFHKLALSAVTGSTNVHTLNEHLFDTMHRLGHTYIDVLKVDIEGGEWGVFNDIFYNNRNSNSTVSHKTNGNNIIGKRLPVGQLLIEMHYKTMKEINTFFRGAHADGFRIFSREMNLQPCIGRNLPDAAEYALINPDNYYNSKLKFHQLPAITNEEFHKPVKGLIYFLTRKSRLNQMQSVLEMLYNTFSRYYPQYPVLIFHDDLNSADEVALQKHVPEMPLKFFLVTFKLPENLRKEDIPERTPCSYHSSTIGYRHMCRFHATVIHEILRAEGYGNYEYVMRLDDDSSIDYPIGYDLFKFMKSNNKLYGFINLVQEEDICVHNLWESTNTFIKESNHEFHSDMLYYKLPKGLVFYNNFEISHFSIWSNPIWTDYMSYVDRIGGIYKLRWGDAPLHTIGVSLSVPKQFIHSFTDISYKHEPFLNQKPTGLPMPGIDPFLTRDIRCNFYDKWVCKTIDNQNITTNITFSNISDLEIESRLVMKVIPIHKVLHTSGDSPYSYTQASEVTSPNARLANNFANSYSNSYGGLSDYNKAVLYTFSETTREKKLAATLINYYENYAKFHNCPFLVFYSSTDKLDFKLLARVLPTNVFDNTIFRSVVLVDMSVVKKHFNENCDSPTDKERSIARFMRYQVIQELISMGYRWFMPFDIGLKLNSPITYNIFQQLQLSGKRYAYSISFPDHSDCFGGPWKLAQGICEALKKKDEKCSEMFYKWKAGDTILTNFAISHISLWQTKQCSELFLLSGESNTSISTSSIEQSSNNYKKIIGNALASNELMLERYNYKASALHTLCVIMSLNIEEIGDITSIPHTNDWKHATVSVTMSYAQENRTNDIQHYKSLFLDSYNRIFSPQRFGWNGGDVASSVPLPNERNICSPSEKLLWLFGDTYIGMSTETARIKEYSKFVANSVGVSHLDINSYSKTKRQKFYDITKTAFYWGQDSATNPAALLKLVEGSSNKVCSKKGNRPAFWPTSGVPILIPKALSSVRDCGSSDNYHVKLLIIGGVICRHDSEETTNGRIVESLSFETVKTVMLLVHNPYDPPNMWKSSQITIPSTPEGFYTWDSITSASGRRYALLEDSIYLVGNYLKDVTVRSKLTSKLVIGRAKVTSILHAVDSSAESIIDFDIEVLATSDQSSLITEWVSVFSASDKTLTPLGIVTPSIPETSVHFDKRIKKWILVGLYLSDSNVQSCTSPSIEGPWDCAYINKVQDLYSLDTNLITYAGKAHLDLINQDVVGDGINSMVISYVSNLADTNDLVFTSKYREVYIPKFTYIEQLER